MPTYNGAAYLGHTLASIDCQASDQIEVIAVDDGSNDATLDILRAFGRRLPLRILARPRVGNWVANTNHGLKEARGRYVCFLHQDDLWLPGRVQALRHLVARDTNVAMVFHSSRYIDSRGSWLGAWHAPLPPGLLPAGSMIERLLVQNFIAVPAPMFSREVALDVGGLDESLWYTADWDFWLKLARKSPAIYCPKPLTAFRIHPQSQTAKGVAYAWEMRRQIEVVLRNHLPAWEAVNPGRPEIGRTARLSMEVNYALASCVFGDHPNWAALGWELLALGPSGWLRLMRDSRIIERVAGQARARLARSKDATRLFWTTSKSAVATV